MPMIIPTTSDYIDPILHRLDAIERRLGSKLLETEGRITTRVDALETLVTERLDSVDESIQGIDTSLEEIDGKLERLDGRLDEVDNRLDDLDKTIDSIRDLMRAESCNVRIMNRNRAVQASNVGPYFYQPLQRTSLEEYPRQKLLSLGLPPNVVLKGSRQRTVAIGNTPANFNPNVATYSHLEIFEMMFFYDDDFGILAGEGLQSRVRKFRDFLVGM